MKTPQYRHTTLYQTSFSPPPPGKPDMVLPLSPSPCLPPPSLSFSSFPSPCLTALMERLAVFCWGTSITEILTARLTLAHHPLFNSTFSQRFLWVCYFKVEPFKWNLKTLKDHKSQ